MTSAILGPPRHGLVPMACGWDSEMNRGAFRSRQDVDADMKSIDFLRQCGVDWLSDSHPWGGETGKMNFPGGQPAVSAWGAVPRVPGTCPSSRREGRDVRYAQQQSSLDGRQTFSSGQTRMAYEDCKGGLSGERDHPEGPGNCLANRPFLDWLTRINLQGLATGYYGGLGIDGDFFGTGGWYTTVIPATCTSDRHDHLPGDSNYACQRALQQLIDNLRRHHPELYILTCRPPMDLGVWSLHNVDACFTLLEAGTQANLTAGDQIRTWSRKRVHHDFFPHYLDQPLAFPT